jgi:hypothetical protein
LIAELEGIANSGRGESVVAAGGACPTPAAFLSCKPEAQARFPAPSGRVNFYVVSVDFEMIPDKACRDRAWLLPTNWGLRQGTVPALVDLSKVILSNSVDLAKFYKDTNGRKPQALEAPQSFDAVCASLESIKD